MQSVRASVAESDRESLQRRVLVEQLAMMCRYSQTSLLLGFFLGIFFCWLIRADNSVGAVLGWFATLIVISALRGLLQHRYLRDREQLNPERWAHYIKAAIAVNGFVWCIPSTFMIPSQPAAQVVIGIVSVGMSATVLVSLTPVRHAYACFIVPYLAPIGILYFTMGHDYANMAIGLFAFLFAMLGVAQRNTRGTEELLRLQFDHAALAERLRRENEIVERANRDLESQIVQRERTEAELRVAKSQAESANRAKNQFLANMSHELRTPLNAVIGMSDLLIRALANMGSLSKQLKQAHAIRASGDRLLRLIDDILDMARIEAGAMRFERAPFDPRRLTSDTAESFHDDIAQKSLALAIAIADDVPTSAIGDALRVRQVLTNLIANAIKFTPSGRIQIDLRVATNEARQSLFRWSISDTGIGVATTARDHLFQPFSQLDDSSTRRFGGSGLGLAICRQIVTALGGRIDVESEAGQGSKFWFEVPLEIAAGESSAPLPHDESPHLKGRVLVVEDNETNSDLIVEMLRVAGCDAITATNGVEALDKLQRESVDAVLMDWHMPQLDGIAVTRTIREREKQSGLHMPIVALTASVLAGDRETCLAAGMDDFIPKPFTYDQLTRVMSRWLAQIETVS